MPDEESPPPADDQQQQSETPPAPPPENIAEIKRAAASWRQKAEKLQRQLDEAANQTRTEREELMKRLLKAEVRAAAAGKLQNPDDAEKFLDMAAFSPSAEGEYDIESIKAAVDQLLTERPYLAPPKTVAPPPLPSNNNQEDQQQPVDMNTLIRRAAGKMR